MKMSGSKQAQAVIDNDLLALLDAAVMPVTMPANRKRALHSQILERIEQSKPDPAELLLTIRHSDGIWIQLTPTIQKKQLFIDYDKGVENYLLKFEPGAQSPAHDHQDDEYCMVLEGSISFDDIHLHAGDYHIARKGSHHGFARSETGALLYLQSAISEEVNI